MPPKKWFYIGINRYEVKTSESPFSLDKILLRLPCKEEDDIAKISALIRTKQNWWELYKTQAAIKRWKKEASQKFDFTEATWDYVIKELEYYDEVMKRTDREYEMGPIDSIFLGDIPVDSNSMCNFRKNVDKLAEQVRVSEKKWPLKDDKRKPGSCWHCLDPNLFAFMYDFTEPYKSGGVGMSANCDRFHRMRPIISYHPNRLTIKSYFEALGESYTAQWMPSLVKVDEKGHAKFLSYINNVHPVIFKAMYPQLEEILSKVIPAINGVLGEYASGQRVRFDEKVYQEAKDSKKETTPLPETEKGAKPELAAFEKLQALTSDVSTVDGLPASNMFAPEPPNPYWVQATPDGPPRPQAHWTGLPTDRQKFDVRGRELRVITEMFQYDLTPEHPRAKAQKWHMSGMINEDIVCSVIYVYDSQNVTNALLHFNGAFTQPDPKSVFHPFISGKEGDKLVTEVAKVKLNAGSVVAWPNTMQWRIPAFGLKDHKKKGSLSIVCFHIVDPYNHLVFTTDQVPPKRVDWEIEEIRSILSVAGNLPAEISDMVLEYLFASDPEWKKRWSRFRERQRSSTEREKEFRDLKDPLYQGPFNSRRHIGLRDDYGTPTFWRLRLPHSYREEYDRKQYTPGEEEKFERQFQRDRRRFTDLDVYDSDLTGGGLEDLF